MATIKSSTVATIKTGTVAKDILNVNHPLHTAFVRFCGGNDHTIRQARKYLAAFPALRALTFRKPEAEAA